MTTEAIKKKILPILKRQGVIRAAVFGSFARGEMKKSSDVDILVKLRKDKTLLDLVGLQLELQDKLGRKVDVVEYGALHPLIKNIVLKEQKKIKSATSR